MTLEQQIKYLTDASANVNAFINDSQDKPQANDTGKELPTVSAEPILPHTYTLRVATLTGRRVLSVTSQTRIHNVLAEDVPVPKSLAEA